MLINISISGSFTPNRCIRQGDPFSHFLFILCAEVPFRLLYQVEMDEAKYGIKISCRAPTISHLLYADDILLTCRISVKDVRKIQ